MFTLTLLVNLSQFVFGGVLGQLQRRPAGLHGDWWRTGTALLVQDGGVFGAVSNLLFLAVIGIAAEQIVTRWQWLAGYLGAAAVGEFAGYAWQPVGGGNSIAICGLAALVAVAYWRRGAFGLPPFVLPAVALWFGVLLGTWWYPLIGAGIAAMAISQRVRLPGWAYAAGAAAVGVLLCAVQNVHGAALLAGLGIAAAMLRPDRRPGRVVGVSSDAG